MKQPFTRPRILVTVDREAAGGGWSDYAEDYAAAIEAAGGTAIPFHYETYMASAAPAHDGLVTIGGADVDPSRYGAPRDRTVRTTVPARDDAELALTRSALAAKLPLLGICRGAQLLNIAAGGTLLQHIIRRMPHRGPRGTGESGWHPVQVAPGSLLARIAGAGPLLVNSRHHQAVTPERLGPGLVEAGRTDEGGLVVLEAFEVRDHPFALGVQWHPERVEMRAVPALQPASSRLFEALVRASASRHP